jgi:hypothetical protein
MLDEYSISPEVTVKRELLVTRILVVAGKEVAGR